MSRDRCDEDVFKRGRVVCIVANPGSSRIEAWVGLLALLTWTRTDWSWFGGRAVVKTLGDPDRVRAAARVLRHLLPDAIWHWWEAGA